MFKFNLGLNQKRLGAGHSIPTVAIHLGATKGRGSSTRMFNYCTKRSANPSECINQFITIEPTKIVTTPDAPIITNIISGNLKLLVVFTAPLNDGGSSITDYEYSTDNGSTFTSAGTTSSPFEITGLTNGTTYQVVIRAVNSKGSGTSSNKIDGTPNL